MKVVHNWGRWIAHCDSPVCVGAEQVWVGNESVVCQCHDTQLCQHGLVCGNLTVLEWPEDPEAILEVLAERPYVGNRHWYPPETVADLRAENEVHL